ncbi:thioesterase domain-containing protein [Hyalangium versicolor]|uniref:thioesterase domain-containing protein n=1 Tax=Hyalangium versicolor TaxID=2861190 RepID=UPI001CCB4344|nr:thioesterase domain-containing protein [Hyalangium versicolor]
MTMSAPLSQAKQELLRALIQNRDASSKDTPSNLIQFKKGEAGVPPFFFFPATDGGVSYFRHMAPHLPERRAFYGIQAPGFDEEREPLRSVEEVVDYGMRHLRALQPHGPYYIGGFCMGGLPSYELACRLQEAGEEVAMLVQVMPVFLRPWACLPGTDALQLRAIEDHHFIFERLLGIHVPLPMEKIRSLPETERYDYVTGLVRDGGYLKGPAEEHLFRHRMKMYEAGLSAMLNYKPQRRLKGHVEVLLVGRKEKNELELDMNTSYTVHLRALPPEQIRYHRLNGDAGALFSGSDPDTGDVARALGEFIK